MTRVERPPTGFTLRNQSDRFRRGNFIIDPTVNHQILLRLACIG